MFEENIFVFILLGLLLLIVFSAVKAVPQGQEWTVERFGRYTRTLSPGLNLIVPIYDRIGRKLTMMEQVLEIPRQDVITKDNAMVTTDGIAFFQVIDAARAAYEVKDLERAVANLTLTNIRTVIGSMDLDEVLSKRDEINERLLRVVDAATGPWGIKIMRIEIKDLTPPSDITDSMARQMKAERERRAEVITAEGEKQAAILRAEGQKQSQILEAEGRREAAFRDAEARERAAEAEGKATEVVSAAIAAGDVQAINYFVAQKYVEAFRALATAPNQKFVIVPSEMSGLLSSIAGVGELAKAALGGGDGGRTPPPPAARQRPGAVSWQSGDASGSVPRSEA
ncbi:MAG: SPFH/Band 7/PHB domain protein [Alphaproteobacteria bacterium]|nr:SPFH/Band 7/PHB domain protein [Alphaproteobacteria bacterium]